RQPAHDRPAPYGRRYTAALMQDSTLTTNQPNGSSDRVSSQVTSQAMQATRNHMIADSRRPCTSWPRPGMMKLQMAAMTLPAVPCPLPIGFAPLVDPGDHARRPFILA